MDHDHEYTLASTLASTLLLYLALDRGTYAQRDKCPGIFICQLQLTEERNIGLQMMADTHAAATPQLPEGTDTDTDTYLDMHTYTYAYVPYVPYVGIRIRIWLREDPLRDATAWVNGGACAVDPHTHCGMCRCTCIDLRPCTCTCMHPYTVYAGGLHTHYGYVPPARPPYPDHRLMEQRVNGHLALASCPFC
jgi:hypothetical protein